MLGDNPMQSEFCCHRGLAANYFCRACWVHKGSEAEDEGSGPPEDDGATTATDATAASKRTKKKKKVKKVVAKPPSESFSSSSTSISRPNMQHFANTPLLLSSFHFTGHF